MLLLIQFCGFVIHVWCVERKYFKSVVIPGVGGAGPGWDGNNVLCMSRLSLVIIAFSAHSTLLTLIWPLPITLHLGWNQEKLNWELPFHSFWGFLHFSKGTNNCKFIENIILFFKTFLNPNSSSSLVCILIRSGPGLNLSRNGDPGPWQPTPGAWLESGECDYESLSLGNN